MTTFEVWSSAVYMFQIKVYTLRFSITLKRVLECSDHYIRHQLGPVLVEVVDPARFARNFSWPEEKGLLQGCIFALLRRRVGPGKLQCGVAGLPSLGTGPMAF